MGQSLRWIYLGEDLMNLKEIEVVSLIIVSEDGMGLQWLNYGIELTFTLGSTSTTTTQTKHTPLDFSFIRTS